MKDEIKEILESLRKIIKLNRENGFDRIIMLGDDIDKLLDYITNLQEENETLKELNVCVGCENNIDYKSRCEKAIEYLLNNKLYTFKYDDEELFEITTDKKAKDDLLKILGGDE